MQHRTFGALVLVLILSPTINAVHPRPLVRVGIDEGDLRGEDHRVLQAAIDYVANLKGGTVEILPGRYYLRDSLHLRTGVNLVGTRGKSILVLEPGQKTALVRDLAKGATEITLTNPEGFQIGDGVFLQDQAGHGFEVTTATIIARTGPKSFRLSQAAASDYLLKRGAEVKRGFSGIAGWNIKDVDVEGITIEGSWGQEGSEYLGGCRGGGLYLFGCDKVTLRQCTVYRFNGDAISFQGKCRNLTIEHCLCESNANVGLHPGSYSSNSMVRANVLRKNGYVGLFVCVGVKGVRFENNEIVANAGCGISIGFEDSNNFFGGNRIIGNAETGVLFRRDSPKAEHGAHGNVFEKNIIRDNLGPRPDKSNSRPSSAGKACVVIEGRHHDLVFRDNDMGFSQPHTGSAFLHDAVVNDLKLLDNRLQNLKHPTKVFQDDR